MELRQHIAIALSVILIVNIGGSLTFLPEHPAATGIGNLRPGWMRNRDESDQKGEGSYCNVAYGVG